MLFTLYFTVLHLGCKSYHCILRSNRKHTGKILNSKDIANLLDMNESNARNIISSLKKKGIIGQHETGSILSEEYKIKRVYTVNPYIFCRGVNVSSIIISFYDKTGWNKL